MSYRSTPNCIISMLNESITALNSNNCDMERPYQGQQPLRSQMLIHGLTRRDIEDCMVLGILDCKETTSENEFPRQYVSTTGQIYNSFESLLASTDDFVDSYINPTEVTYNDLYGWNLDTIDPVAAVLNMACHLERRMGVYPALLDGELSSSTTKTKHRPVPLHTTRTLPMWNTRDDAPTSEGEYIVKWDNGDYEIAWWVKYGTSGTFQRRCGTDEGRDGWKGNVGHVVKWAPIYIPL